MVAFLVASSATLWCTNFQVVKSSHARWVIRCAFTTVLGASPGVVTCGVRPERNRGSAARAADRDLVAERPQTVSRPDEIDLCWCARPLLLGPHESVGGGSP